MSKFIIFFAIMFMLTLSISATLFGKKDSTTDSRIDMPMNGKLHDMMIKGPQTGKKNSKGVFVGSDLTKDLMPDYDANKLKFMNYRRLV